MEHDILKVLTFYLGAEEYGIPLVQAREIFGVTPTTLLPQAAEHVIGLINLRGEILPVFDLRRLFGLQSESMLSTPPCVLVAETRGEPVGLQVDGVHQVLPLSPEQIDPPTDALKARSVAITGLGKVGSRLVILLDPDALFPDPDGTDSSLEPASEYALGRARRDG